MNRFTATIDDALQRILPDRLRRIVLRAIHPRRFTSMRALHRQLQSDDDHSPLAHDCIFIHIPKTGGVSVAEALFGGKLGGHRTLRDWQLVLDRADLQHMFTFGFVRNPWDRLASAFAFLKAGGRNEFDARWAAKHLAEIDTFDEFVRRWLNRSTIWSRQHFWPQYWFMQDQPRQVGVDFVGRFERLGEDYARLRDRLGIGLPALPHLNVGSGGGRYRELYTPESSEIVARVYRTDIDVFGYQTDAP